MIAEQIPATTDPNVLLNENEARHSRWVKFGIAFAGAAAVVGAYMPTASAEDDPTPPPQEPAPVQVASEEPARPQPRMRLEIGSLNVLSSQHTRRGGYYGKRSDYDRAVTAAEIIRGEHFAPRLDIVGLQEVQPDQERWFRQMLPNYRMITVGGRSNNVTLFDKQRFSLIRSGYISYPSYGDRKHEMSGRAPFVILNDKVTKEKVIDINTHLVAWDEQRDPGGALKRDQGSDILRRAGVEFVQNNPQAIVILKGDMNATNVKRRGADQYAAIPYKDRAVDRNDLPYCNFTERPHLFQHALDMQMGRFGNCPNMSRNADTNRRIDDAYVSYKTAEILGYDYKERYVSSAASDHPLLWVTVGSRRVA